MNTSFDQRACQWRSEDLSACVLTAHHIERYGMKNGSVHLIDQNLLPFEFAIKECRTARGNGGCDQRYGRAWRAGPSAQLPGSRWPRRSAKLLEPTHGDTFVALGYGSRRRARLPATYSSPLNACGTRASSAANPERAASTAVEGSPRAGQQ